MTVGEGCFTSHPGQACLPSEWTEGEQVPWEGEDQLLAVERAFVTWTNKKIDVFVSVNKNDTCSAFGWLELQIIG